MSFVRFNNPAFLLITQQVYRIFSVPYYVTSPLACLAVSYFCTHSANGTLFVGGGHFTRNTSFDLLQKFT